MKSWMTFLCIVSSESLVTCTGLLVLTADGAEVGLWFSSLMYFWIPQLYPLVLIHVFSELGAVSLGSKTLAIEHTLEGNIYALFQLSSLKIKERRILFILQSLLHVPVTTEHSECLSQKWVLQSCWLFCASASNWFLVCSCLCWSIIVQLITKSTEPDSILCSCSHSSALLCFPKITVSSLNSWWVAPCKVLLFSASDRGWRQSNVISEYFGDCFGSPVKYVQSRQDYYGGSSFFSLGHLYDLCSFFFFNWKLATLINTGDTLWSKLWHRINVDSS